MEISFQFLDQRFWVSDAPPSPFRLGRAGSCQNKLDVCAPHLATRDFDPCGLNPLPHALCSTPHAL
jgi:hypothetical protein